jgi:hypothetical protein
MEEFGEQLLVTQATCPMVAAFHHLCPVTHCEVDSRL